MPALRIRPKSRQLYMRGGAKSLKGGVQAKLADNLRVSPFNKDLSNDPTFCHIHLAGQSL
jgi:hypothetical protein